MKEIIKQGQVATLQEKALQAKEVILGATTPKELTQAVVIAAQARETIKEAKDKLKELEKNPKATIKEMENIFEDLEKSIKAKFTETYNSQKVVKQVKDLETGEVHFKEDVLDNKGKGIFIYTPKKVVKATNLDKITREKYPHLFKQEWVLDMEALANEDATKLPIKKVTTKAKVGIQYAKALEVIKGVK